MRSWLRLLVRTQIPKGHWPHGHVMLVLCLWCVCAVVLLTCVDILYSIARLSRHSIFSTFVQRLNNRFRCSSIEMAPTVATISSSQEISSKMGTVLRFLRIFTVKFGCPEIKCLFSQYLFSDVRSRIEACLKKRIMVFDGGMGTMIQSYNLQEDDFRGYYNDWFDVLLLIYKYK